MQQLNLFDVLQELKPTLALSELFEAYAACRSNKRNTLNALAFEVDYETNLLKLCAQINNGDYQPGKSIAFIVNKPVKREIFAADFMLVPKLQLGYPVSEALASRHRKLELPEPNSQAGAWELAHMPRPAPLMIVPRVAAVSVARVFFDT